MLEDPYAGLETEEERQALYRCLQAKYEADLTEWKQKEAKRRKGVYDSHMTIWHHQREIQMALDKRSQRNVFSLAAGSFGVSFVFINQIVKLDTAANIPVLITAWGLFALAIIMAVLELKVGSVIQDFLLDTVEANIEKGYEGKPYRENNRLAVMLPTRILGWASIASFIAGVVCLLYFVLINTAAA
jgi:hypothetical protein